MARTVEQILKQQLGNLLAEVAMLTASNEQLAERVVELETQMRPMTLPVPKDNDDGPR